MRFPYKGAGIALFCCVDEETYILLGLRSDHPFHKRWSVPGGGFDKVLDKDQLGNAKREFSEETNIDFDSLNTTYIKCWKLRVPFFNWISYIYITDSMQSDCKPNEFYELKWINIKEIGRYKLRPFTRCEINSFCRGRR